jgi:hypothetical protein
VRRPADIRRDARIVLIERIDVELLDYGDEVIARASVSAGQLRYMYETDGVDGHWYAVRRTGDAQVPPSDVNLLVGFPLRQAAEGAAESMLSATKHGDARLLSGD